MENLFDKSLEIFNDEKYEGCAIRHVAKNSEVYMPYQVDDKVFILYKVVVPVVELGLSENNVKEILDYAIENCREIGQPLSASSTFSGIKDIIRKYIDVITRTDDKMAFDFNLLKSGTPLKRKIWKGFWSWDEVRKTIMMHCENGDVIDIRMSKDMDFTLSNMYSLDWEIATPENSKVYERMLKVESMTEPLYKVIAYEHDAFSKLKCPVCGGDINMEYNLYNGVDYVRDCKCRIRIEDSHSVNVEIRQYLNDCELDK